MPPISRRGEQPGGHAADRHHGATASSLVATGTGITAGAGDLGLARLKLHANLSQAVTVSGGTPTLVLNDGGIATYTGGSGTAALTFSYTVAAGQNTADLAVTLAVNLGHLRPSRTAPAAADLSGAVTNPAGILQIDTTGTPSGPAVTSVETSGNGITAGTGDLNVGAVVTLTLHLSEPVSVSTAGGVPTLLLNDGGVATFAGGSGSNTLIFSYTVAAGQNTADLAVTAVDLNGAVVVASPSTIAPGSGQSLTDAYGHVFTFGNAYQGGDYHILRDGVSDGIAATLALVNGVVFAHTASFGWYADSAGHFIYQQTAPVLDSVADLSGAVTNPAGILQIDTTGTPSNPWTPSGPVVTLVETSGNGITAGTGDLNVGAVVTLTLHLSEPVSVSSGVPTLLLNDGGAATFAGGSGSNTLIFSYTVAAGQNTADLAVTAVNLVRDLHGAGNAASHCR